MKSDQYGNGYLNKFLEEFLIPWLRIESISADSSKKEEMQKCADMLVWEFARSGLETQKINLEKGNPLVFSQKIIDESKPTILVYGHYDVQPIHKPKEWVLDGIEYNPFKPQVHDGKLYARGASDDKGQVAAYLLALQEMENIPCNLKFIIEGDEEDGISSFEDYIKKNKVLLSCDLIMISDTSTLIDGIPMIITSIKGIIKSTIQSEKIEDIIGLIHNLHDYNKNRILIPEFYDMVQDFKIDPETVKIIGEPKEEWGQLKPEEGYSWLHHMKYRPSFSPLYLEYSKPYNKGFKITMTGPKKNLHSGGYGGPIQDPCLVLCHILSEMDCDVLEFNYGSKVLSTTIQTNGYAVVDNVAGLDDALKLIGVSKEYIQISEVDKNEKTIKPISYLSFRVVPDQDPTEVLEGFHEIVNKNNCTYSDELIAKPVSMGENKFSKIVIDSLKEGFDVDHVHMLGSGGSIPISSTLSEELKAPIIYVGLAPPDANVHGPNENISVENGIRKGADSIKIILNKIGGKLFYSEH